MTWFKIGSSSVHSVSSDGGAAVFLESLGVRLDQVKAAVHGLRGVSSSTADKAFLLVASSGGRAICGHNDAFVASDGLSLLTKAVFAGGTGPTVLAWWAVEALSRIIRNVFSNGALLWHDCVRRTVPIVVVCITVAWLLSIHATVRAVEPSITWLAGALLVFVLIGAWLTLDHHSGSSWAVMASSAACGRGSCRQEAFTVPAKWTILNVDAICRAVFAWRALNALGLINDTLHSRVSASITRVLFTFLAVFVDRTKCSTFFCL